MTGVLGSSINFTWTFTGAFRTASWGIKNDNDDRVKLELVYADRTGTVTVRDIAEYKHRVSGHWNGRYSPGQLTFILTSLETADARFFSCIVSDNGGGLDIDDAVELLMAGGCTRIPQQINFLHCW